MATVEITYESDADPWRSTAAVAGVSLLVATLITVLWIALGALLVGP